VFCKIIARDVDACHVYEDEHVSVFLDNTPLFPGHCLVCPKQHHELMTDLPQNLLVPVFSVAQLIGRALERGLGAEGSFIAVNNRVSQSVPHLHVHVIPRRRGDGMKGFFWPRRPYRDRDDMLRTQQAIESALTYFRSPDAPYAVATPPAAASPESE
jgi:histidine triad (HIT) family protein